MRKMYVWIKENTSDILNVNSSVRATRQCVSPPPPLFSVIYK